MANGQSANAANVSLPYSDSTGEGFVQINGLPGFPKAKAFGIRKKITRFPS